jgi:hypothetical protein
MPQTSLPALRAERKRREAEKLPPPGPPPSPPLKTAKPPALKGPPHPPSESKKPLPPPPAPPLSLPPPSPEIVEIQVTIYLPEALHARAMKEAAANGLQLTDWLVEKITYMTE